MAQLVLTAGRHAAHAAANWAANAALRAILPAQQAEGPRLPDIQIQTSTNGAPMPRLWGRGRLAGQVIWAARYQEHSEKTQTGGKGGPSRVDYTYSISFAVGLCEGEVRGIGRIWANGALLDPTRYAFRLHTGRETQLPDALITAVEGETAPAFRGTAYVVFEDLPLDEFGHRIPNLSFEVFGGAHRSSQLALEEQITGVNLIPGSGEFAYHPAPVMRGLGPGRETPENQNTGRAVPDFIASIDDLQRELPECRSIQLVISWFGDDLRCGNCQIRPGVETRDKTTHPVSWSVAGQDRASAYLVSQDDGRPAYGGTPDDASIVAAITELKARGFAVTLYPFILMDVPGGNALPDPHGDDEQAMFPWRGRISCHPAPGQPSSVDETSAAADQVADFFGSAAASDFSVSNGLVSYGGPVDWGFSRFILHCAALAKAAGGVDGFLIGSEMVGLSVVRGASNTYPAVAHLKDLAAEARVLLGVSTRLSYAADWTEYAGHQPGGGEKIFHLDPLWSDPNIDAVAIDWYVPLTDWRAAEPNIDALIATGSHDRSYLAGGVQGGEGYDWYYADASDREAQIRTPIIDGVHGEDWIWRVKDLVNWWGQPHHDRPGGLRSAMMTGWVPESKPIWLTEIGCPAIDRGGNQPNVFVDPKSAESSVPHGSTGARDDLVQRRYIEAMLSHWTQSGQNPVSGVYGGQMVDPDLVHVWAWDARPWPDFPARSEIWADGENWRLGHWLNGRTGLVPVSAIVEDLCLASGLTAYDITRLDDVVSGFLVDRPMSARTALAPLALALGIAAWQRSSAVHFVSSGWGGPVLDLIDPVSGASAMEIEDGAIFDLPRDLQLAFIDDTAAYAPGLVSAHRLAKTANVQRLVSPLLADPDLARRWSEDALAAFEQAARRWNFGLPPSFLSVELGDMLDWSGEVLVLQASDGVAQRNVSGGRPDARNAQIVTSLARPSEPSPPGAQPDIAVLDLAPIADEARRGPLISLFADPAPDAFDVYIVEDEVSAERLATVSANAVMGVLKTSLLPGARGRWDRLGQVEVELHGGRLESRTALAVLNGANLAAIEGADGEWEVVQFADAVLVGERRYRLTSLLRGQAGSDPAVGAMPGARFVLLDRDLLDLPLPERMTGLPLVLRAVPAGRPVNYDRGTEIGFSSVRRDRLPLAPVHPRVRSTAAGIELSWVRCAAIGGDDWHVTDVPLGQVLERYRVELIDNGAVFISREVTEPVLSVVSADLLAHYGIWPAAIEVAIAQLSDQGDPGRWVQSTLSL
jgi:hypothetical protein